VKLIHLFGFITKKFLKSVFFDKLTVSQLVKDFSIIYGNRRFTDLTRLLTIENNFLPAGPGPARKLSTNLYDIYQCRVYSE